MIALLSRRRSSTVRRFSAIALTTSLALGLGACGSDAKKTVAPTTTTATPKVTTTSTAPTTTTTTDAAPTTSTTRGAETTTTLGDTTDTTDAAPVDNETFAQIIDEVQTQLDAATSACQVRLVFDANTNLPNPANTAQAKLAVGFLVSMYNAIADTAPPAEASNAASFRALAKKVEEYARSVNYDLAALESDKSPFKDDSFVAPLFAFITATDACPGATKISS
jgi:hypothetical protein